MKIPGIRASENLPGTREIEFELFPPVQLYQKVDRAREKSSCRRSQFSPPRRGIIVRTTVYLQHISIFGHSFGRFALFHLVMHAAPVQFVHPNSVLSFSSLASLSSSFEHIYARITQDAYHTYTLECTGRATNRDCVCLYNCHQFAPFSRMH